MPLTDEDLNKIQAMLVGLATKDDLRGFATKDDLRGFVTKDDLRGFATKDDLRGFATKDDLCGFATKDDLCIMKDEIMEELSKKADKGDVDRMESRLITAMGLVERDHDMRLTDLETRVKRLERVPAQ